MDDIQNGGSQDARIERYGFTRLEVNLERIAVFKAIYELAQEINIVAWPRDMMAAAEVDPSQAREELRKFFLENRQSSLKGIGIQFTKIVKVKAIDAFQALRLEILSSNPQTGESTAWVIDGDLHFRMLRVNPYSAGNMFPGAENPWLELPPLSERVEDHMIAVAEQFIHFRIPKSRGEDVDLASKLLEAKACLIQTTGRNTPQDLPNSREKAEHGKSLESHDDPAPCAFLDEIQDLEVLFERSLVNDIARRRDAGEIDFHRLLLLQEFLRPG
jgi:hypothetical protein